MGLAIKYEENMVLPHKKLTTNYNFTREKPGIQPRYRFSFRNRLK